MFKSRWVRGVAIASLLLSLSLGVAACGGGSSTASHQEIARAERHARLVKAEKEKERKLEREIQKLKKERVAEKKRLKQTERHEKKEAEEAHTAAPESTLTPTPAPVASTPSGTDCGSGVVAGPETSCGFALNVQAAYEAAIGSGSGSIEAYSEANKEIYSMFCTAAPHECGGAISATVYFP